MPVVYRSGVQWGNPVAAAAQGAQVGLGMQRNRLAQAAEQREERAQQLSEQEARARMDKYGREEARRMLADVGKAYQVAGMETDPVEQQAVFSDIMARLRPLYPARNGVDPWEDAPDTYEPSQAAVYAPFMPTVETETTLKKTVDPATGKTVWTRASEAAGMEAPTPAPLVAFGDGVGVRALTADEGVSLGLEPGQERGMVVDARGNVSRLNADDPVEQDVRKLQARRREALKPTQNLLNEYVKAVEDAATTLGVVSLEDRATLASMKEALATQIANTVLTGPNDAPSEAQNQAAKDMVPDFSGPYDRSMFGNHIAGIQASIDAVMRGDEPPAGAGTSPAEATVSSDAEYNALPSGTVFTGPDGQRRVKP